MFAFSARLGKSKFTAYDLLQILQNKSDQEISKVDLSVIVGEDYKFYQFLIKGMTPAALPATQLPQSHAVWDRVVDNLPKLFKTYNVKSVLDNMPVLCAKQESLHNQYVTRAMLIITAFLHAYSYFKKRDSNELDSLSEFPESIVSPLRQLSARLGRQVLARLYVDDFAINFLPADDFTQLKPMMSYFDEPEETSITLIVGTICERIFAPSVEAIALAQESVLNKDHINLAKYLSVITNSVEKIIEQLHKLLPGRTNSLDPGIFAQTFYSIGAATHKDGVANFGADALCFRVLDAFFNREFKSKLGQRIRERDKFLPAVIIAFCQLVLNGPSVSEYIEQLSYYEKESVRCITAYNELKAAYNKFLNVHKVIAYLYFKVALFNADNDNRPWMGFYENLYTSQAERFEKELVTEEACLEKITLPSLRNKPLKSFSFAEVAQHYLPNNGWIIIDKYVYDITEFMKSNEHSGGNKILTMSLGKVSYDFLLLHRTHVLEKLKQFCIGKVFENYPIIGASLYHEWLNILYASINTAHFLYLYTNFGARKVPLYIYDNVFEKYVEKCLVPWFDLLNKAVNSTSLIQKKSFYILSSDIDLNDLRENFLKIRLTVRKLVSKRHWPTMQKLIYNGKPPTAIRMNESYHYALSVYDVLIETIRDFNYQQINEFNRMLSNIESATIIDNNLCKGIEFSVLAAVKNLRLLQKTIKNFTHNIAAEWV